jgi:hypothetical protein
MATLEAVRAEQGREAFVVRSTYTHRVHYRGAKERCYLGSLEDCESFAAKVGGCKVVPATAAEIEAEARRVERWRPNY